MCTILYTMSLLDQIVEYKLDPMCDRFADLRPSASIDG